MSSATASPSRLVFPMLLPALIGLLYTFWATTTNLVWAVRAWRPGQWMQFIRGVGDETGTLRIALVLALLAAMFVVASAMAAIIGFMTRKAVLPRLMVVHYCILIGAYALQSIALLEIQPLMPGAASHALQFTPWSAAPFLIYLFFFQLSDEVQAAFQR